MIIPPKDPPPIEYHQTAEFPAETPFQIKQISSSIKDHSDHLTLYIRPQCPYCIKVVNFLHEHKIDIPLVNINQDKKGYKKLITVGGKSQVPCLFINGKPHYESAWIINWLKTHQKDLATEKKSTVEG
jgi:glutaredoxin 3